MIEIWIMTEEVKDHRENMEAEGIEDGWTTSQHLLSNQGWEFLDDERPYRDPLIWRHNKKELEEHLLRYNL